MSNSKADIPYVCAKVHSKELQDRYPLIFSDVIGLKTLEDLVNLLQASLIRVSNDDIVGRLEVRNQDSRILINKNLSHHNQIWTITHEIAHLFLQQNYSEFRQGKSIGWVEAYANHFSCELCLPIKFRRQLLDDLCTSQSVEVVLKIASKFRISISSLFRVMLFESLNFSSADKIWIVAKWRTNKFTNLDPKLRIVSAFYDRDKYYIPENQGLNRLMADISWLSNMNPAVERSTKAEIKIIIKRKDMLPQHTIFKFIGICSAIRLNESRESGTPQIVLLIKINE